MANLFYSLQTLVENIGYRRIKSVVIGFRGELGVSFPVVANLTHEGLGDQTVTHVVVLDLLDVLEVPHEPQQLGMGLEFVPVNSCQVENAFVGEEVGNRQHVEQPLAGFELLDHEREILQRHYLIKQSVESLLCIRPLQHLGLEQHGQLVVEDYVLGQNLVNLPLLLESLPQHIIRLVTSTDVFGDGYGLGDIEVVVHDVGKDGEQALPPDFLHVLLVPLVGVGIMGLIVGNVEVFHQMSDGLGRSPDVPVEQMYGSFVCHCKNIIRQHFWWTISTRHNNICCKVGGNDFCVTLVQEPSRQSRSQTQVICECDDCSINGQGKRFNTQEKSQNYRIGHHLQLHLPIHLFLTDSIVAKFCLQRPFLKYF